MNPEGSSVLFKDALLVRAMAQIQVQGLVFSLPNLATCSWPFGLGQEGMQGTNKLFLKF